ncbi:hypothetical protein [Foetidibacter luteolus]|uniref:hypothetical protein n=1 Tax=Foetidibacter luteolus TaxID=2608880 RepID=UPI00129AB9CE|nr:hypothetical protein [Foetidibacter luteolus]
MEWKSGLILRIKNYKFEDDNSIRDKYSVVLYATDTEAYLIHSLTTSQNNLHVGAQNYGCSVQYNIPYFFFPKNYVVGNENFYFEKDTFIFFNNNVRKESLLKFNLAASKTFGVIKLGVLTNDELKRVLKCALKSKFLTEEVETILSAFKATL